MKHGKLMRRAVMAMLLLALAAPSYAEAWVLVLGSGQIAAAKADGQVWDIDNSPPEPFVVATLRDGPTEWVAQEYSASLSNTYRPRWDERLLVVTLGQTVRIQVFDKDLAVNDFMGEIDLRITPDLVRRGEARLRLIGQVKELILRLEPTDEQAPSAGASSSPPPVPRGRIEVSPTPTRIETARTAAVEFRPRGEQTPVRSAFRGSVTLDDVSALIQLGRYRLQERARTNFRLLTPVAVAAVRGTDYLIEVPASDTRSVTATVYEGSIHLYSLISRETTEIPAGERVHIDSTGVSRRVRLPADRPPPSPLVLATVVRDGVVGPRIERVAAGQDFRDLLVVLDWPEVAGATGYAVYIRNGATGSWRSIHSTTAQRVVLNLPSWVVHHIAIVSTNAHGASDPEDMYFEFPDDVLTPAR